MSRIDINTNITNVVKKYFTSFSKSIVSRFYSKTEIDKKMANIDSRSVIGSELDYGLFGITPDSLSVTQGSVVKFDKTYPNSSLTITNGKVRLKAGRKYTIKASLGTNTLSNYTWYQIFNETDNIALGKKGWAGTINNTNLPAIASITPNKDIDIALRTDNTANTTYTIDSAFVKMVYLEVQEVGRTTIIDPVQQIDKESGIQDTPVGHIMSVMGLNAPAHYLVCDGKTYNIVDYHKLANYFLTEFGKINYFGGDGITTFAVPDMRGEFVRGYDPTNVRDIQGSTRGLGKHQDATQIPNIWMYNNGSTQTVVAEMNSDKSNNTILNADKYLTASSRVYKDLGYSTFSSSPGVSATYANIVRPTNVNVLYCIKFEPTYFMNYSPQYAGFESKVLYQGTAGTVGKYNLSNDITDYQLLNVECSIVMNDGTKVHSMIIQIDVSSVSYLLKYQFSYNISISGSTRRTLFSFDNSKTLSVDVIDLTNTTTASTISINKVTGIKSGATVVSADFTVTDTEADATVAQVWNEVGV